MRVRDRIRSVLETAGTTYAEQAGIRLADRPAPLYRLLVLSVLLSTRIKADIAVAAARELFAAGCGTPRGMLKASGWTYPASRSDWPDWWMLRTCPPWPRPWSGSPSTPSSPERSASDDQPMISR